MCQVVHSCKIMVNFAIVQKQKTMSDSIVNKVAQSSLQEINLAAYYPQEEVLFFDIKPYLFKELILKEKDFRSSLQQQDFSIYQHKLVAIGCSADAIIPVWAYMLVASYLQPVAKELVFGGTDFLRNTLLLKNINAIKIDQFTDKRVVIKGCGDIAIEALAYVEITKLLRPVAKSIMYGEPCSTVPIYKKVQ
jgi:hypothetical protein